jgi:hypothetical protein
MKDLDFKELIEKKLDGALNPVPPRRNYVEELQKRLSSKAEVSVEYPNYLITVLTLSSGLVIGAFLMVFLNKMFKLIYGKKAAES